MLVSLSKGQWNLWNLLNWNELIPDLLRNQEFWGWNPEFSIFNKPSRWCQIMLRVMFEVLVLKTKLKSKGSLIQWTHQMLTILRKYKQGKVPNLMKVKIKQILVTIKQSKKFEWWLYIIILSSSWQLLGVLIIRWLFGKHHLWKCITILTDKMGQVSQMCFKMIWVL